MKPSEPFTHRERVYRNQIKRLAHRNILLAEGLAHERHLRQKAYQWYQDRLMSRFAVIVDMAVMSFRRPRS